VSSAGVPVPEESSRRSVQQVENSVGRAQFWREGPACRGVQYTKLEKVAPATIATTWEYPTSGQPFWALITGPIMHRIKHISAKSTGLGGTTPHLERGPIIELLDTDCCFVLKRKQHKVEWGQKIYAKFRSFFTRVKIREGVWELSKRYF